MVRTLGVLLHFFGVSKFDRRCASCGPLNLGFFKDNHEKFLWHIINNIINFELKFLFSCKISKSHGNFAEVSCAISVADKQNVSG